LLTLATVGYLLGAAGAQDDAPSDQEKMLGTWKVVSAEDSGRPAPDEILSKLQSWIVTKDKITYQFGDMKTEWSYKLDSTRQPKWIDLTEGKLTSLGIYELEGDNWKVCIPEGRPGERSTAFESKPDSANDLLIILKREQP
jgi:uncharacterized protein (TIGR03067 family)